MNRCVWIILNRNFEIILDAEISENRLKDKKFTLDEHIWTNELPELKISDNEVQKEYDEFRADILTLFLEVTVDEIFINAKIGEESEYNNEVISQPLIIQKIKDYDVYI